MFWGVFQHTYRSLTQIPEKNGTPGELYSINQTSLRAHAEQRGIPGRQRRRECVPLYINRHVFLRSIPLWYNAGLLPLQEEREKEDQHLYAPGARGGAAGVGCSAQEAQPHFSSRSLGAALGTGASAFLW